MPHTNTVHTETHRQNDCSVQQWRSTNTTTTEFDLEMGIKPNTNRTHPILFWHYYALKNGNRVVWLTKPKPNCNSDWTEQDPKPQRWVRLPSLVWLLITHTLNHNVPYQLMIGINWTAHRHTLKSSPTVVNTLQWNWTRSAAAFLQWN